MAVILLGKSICRLCNTVIDVEDDVVGFPPFSADPSDPYTIFSDAAFHEACFEKHPLAQGVTRRLSELTNGWKIGGPDCYVCKQQITQPDEHFGLYHLTDAPDHSLYPYNNIHMHRSCLKDFDGLAVVLQAEGLSDALMNNLAELKRIISE